MIVDLLKNAKLYAGDKKLARALDYLAKTDFKKMEPGKVELDGAKLFALIQAPTTRAKESAQFEAHRKYIDVQYIVEGTEQMGYAPIATLKTSVPYDETKDAEMLKGDGDFVTFRPGMFVVFFPEDAHMPCLTCTAPVQVRKVVVKVAVA